MMLSRWGGLLVAGGLAVALLAGLRVPQAVAAWRQNHERIRQLQTETADLTKDIAMRRERIRQLRESRSRQELEMRQQRKMLRPGETTVVTPGQPPQ
jgi:septal ring factor EnvC (AmiA/AmiB activator)